MALLKTKPAETPAKKKSALREWWDSVLFAVIAATLIRWLVMTAFTIPTPSMENSLMVGDFLFVSRLHYGTQTPRTPLQIPLTHQTIWLTKIPSYSDAIQLPSYRLPGFTKPKSGDVVVFYIPPKELNDGVDRPVDLKTNYIKRCIGAPGDVLEIRRRQVYLNGKPMENPPRMQMTYQVETSEELDETFFRRYGIVNDYRDPSVPTLNWSPQQMPDSVAKVMRTVGYSINTTETVAAELRKVEGIKSVTAMENPADTPQPQASAINLNPLFQIMGGQKFGWSIDNYGPITVPKKGATVPVNPTNIAIYGNVIQKYDGNENVVLTDSTVSIGGKAITQYTFKQDYYFMMGDNRHNSLDSRFWGFVPEDHIVGKAVFVWMSLDPNPDKWYNKIRWNRVFRTID